MPKKRRILIYTLLMLSIGNYARLTGNENIRAIQFVSIFIIGALTGILIQDLGQRIKREEKKQAHKV